jgi:hypothetical protein
VGAAEVEHGVPIYGGVCPGALLQRYSGFALTTIPAPLIA